jgi:hypothetical protein
MLKCNHVPGAVYEFQGYLDDMAKVCLEIVEEKVRQSEDGRKDIEVNEIRKGFDNELSEYRVFIQGVEQKLRQMESMEDSMRKANGGRQ